MPSRIAAGFLELRRLEVAHANSIVDAVAASLSELGVWFPWAQTQPEVGDQIDRARAAWQAFDAGTDHEFSLIEVESAELVGGLRINPLAGPAIAEIGYWVRSDRHRRGYATRAVRAATAAVFNHLLGVEVVEIRMDIENGPSAGVARAAGFALDREIDREITAPGHTGRAFVWRMMTEWANARLPDRSARF